MNPLTLIDRGGTFTDVVHVDSDGNVTLRKVPSDSTRVRDHVRGDLRFGTTVATNALLERTGVSTLLLTDEHLEDLPRLGDMTRPRLFEPDVRTLPPLCAVSLGVAGRMAADGTELEPLQLPDPHVLEGFDAVAIVRLNSHVNPAHELALARWVALHRPDVFVAVGHVVHPVRGLLARLETTLVHAAITPVLQAALRRDELPVGAAAIRSDGTLCPASALTGPDAVLSGPAGGVLAVREVAKAAGFEQAIGLDMGGTSADICRVAGRLPTRTGAVSVAGVRLHRDMLAVDTIASGGGSILWNDGVRLGVGPRSAGSHPGPQCYGRGGPPTLTDAALVLGWVDPDAFDPPLDPACVDLPGDAGAFVAIAREQMATAIRALVLGQGADPREHALVAYGGAAGQHAAAVADALGIRDVLVPAAASVLSAWGQAFAELATVEVVDPTGMSWEAVVERSAGVDRADVVVRWSGTDANLRLPLETTESAQVAAYASAHRARFGHAGDGELEVVRLILTCSEAAPGIRAPRMDVRTDDTVLHLGTTSIVVPAHWSATVADDGVRLRRTGEAPRHDDLASTPMGVALWAARFMAVAESGGAVLQRSARSVSVRERLDFSCAVFDPDGTLVANAPHIPVHLGAMGTTVRSLIAERDPAPGTHWLCNDPDAGGSHLPDLTVVSVGELGDGRVFVASRAHHVDVGGLTPGSMPPASSTLADEGEVFRHVQLGDLRALDLGACRQPATVRADLGAQVAANTRMLEELRSLGPPRQVLTWLGHVLDATEVLTRRLVEDWPSQAVTVTDAIDGVPLELRMTRVDGHLCVDFRGTGGPHVGNLNAPPAVVRAAVLYALRVLLATDLPLNEGVLRCVELVLPPSSILSPPRGAAIVGGNVETSMRIADLILRAAERSAASAGTMSNLTLGGDGWSFYETLAGGHGATPHADGVSGRQAHMTNTRVTDAEELEHRLPLRVRRFALRTGSGGAGRRVGGDGLVREIEVLEPCTATLLATRRVDGAPGLDGGGAGQPGMDAVFRGGEWSAWDGQAVELEVGDRVRVGTPGGGGCGPWRQG